MMLILPAVRAPLPVATILTLDTTLQEMVSWYRMLLRVAVLCDEVGRDLSIPLAEWSVSGTLTSPEPGVDPAAPAHSDPPVAVLPASRVVEQCLLILERQGISWIVQEGDGGAPWGTFTLTTAQLLAYCHLAHHLQHLDEET